MKSLADINVSDVFVYLKNLYNKTTKWQKIVFFLLAVLLTVGYIYGKNWWLKYNMEKNAQNIINKIVKSEKDFFQANGSYKKDLFKDNDLVRELDITSSSRSGNYDIDNRRNSRYRRGLSRLEEESFDTGYSGDFRINVDVENTCLVLTYQKDIQNKTIFYASFDDPQALCQGKKCFKQSNNTGEGLCYSNGNCFFASQLKETERPCGDGKGSQIRKCVTSCEGGTCEPWGPCVCKKGFEWDGKTCKQLQTEKDCTAEQCFNGTYCEDREPIEKEIENGSCKRYASCQKNTGWTYTSWECSCVNNDFCPLNESCSPYPGDKKNITLPNNEGSCTNIYYTCSKNIGWQEKARNCVCEKIGTFWNSQTGLSKCSDCTNKPVGAIYTSAAKDQNNCLWECTSEYQKRHGTCLKPDGQFLCVRTELEICTDEFSKKRKLKEDEKTNEGQLCYVEDKENVLFYNKKDKVCRICQCVNLTSGQISQ